MPSVRYAALGFFGLALAGCATLEQLPTERVGSAILRLGNGVPAGTAQLLGSGTTLNISVALAGLTPGTHGVHLHMTGSCEAPDFQSAGGHLDPGGREHGTENPQGAHLGDLPNVMIGANGAGTVSATLRQPRAAALAAIFDADGTAVVVHEGADDYRTDPSGNSGERVACGVFTRS
jgi:Cu-Zn family superoxide dismutase